MICWIFRTYLCAFNIDFLCLFFISFFVFLCFFFFFQAEDGIRDRTVTGVQTCALPISISADVLVGGAQLVNGRPARTRGYEHLAQAVAAEIAVKLSSKGHLSRNLHRKNGQDRSFVPIPSIGLFGFRIPRYAVPGAAVLVCRGFLEAL